MHSIWLLQPCSQTLNYPLASCLFPALLFSPYFPFQRIISYPLPSNIISMIKHVFSSTLKRPRKILFTLLVLLLVSGSVLAATITVRPGESIQEAIDLARPGDTIEVMSGTYSGILDITKEVSLIGIDSGEGMPVINAGSIIGSVFMTANNSRISGFKIVNRNGDGIDVISSKNIISNNTIEACGAAIYLLFSEGNTISNNNVTIRCQGVMGILSSDGIMLAHSDENLIQGNIASGASMGIYLYYSHNNTILRNTAQMNDHGIAIKGSKNNTVLENCVCNSKEEGIGLLSGCTGNSVTKNNVTNNSIGIYLRDSNHNIVYLNDFIDNLQNALSSGSENRWHSPEEISYSCSSKGYTGFLGNYWSDYEGTDTDGNGLGDVSHRFEYDSQDDYPLMIPGCDLIRPKIIHKGMVIER